MHGKKSILEDDLKACRRLGNEYVRRWRCGLPVAVCCWRANRWEVAGAVSLGADGKLLSAPAGWCPGVVAVSLMDDRCWLAVGGNDYDGAKVWARLAARLVAGGAA